MKLYRGIKSEEFNFVSGVQARETERDWKRLLERRAKGDFVFPKDLSPLVNKLHREGRYRRQHFTDDRAIAEHYARSNKGALIEVDVPVAEIAKHFHLEFQNFSARTKKFEIVYVIESSVLELAAKRWKLRVLKFGATSK